MIQYLADNVVNSNAVERLVRVWVYELNSLFSVIVKGDPQN